MANSKGEGSSSNPNCEQILEDLVSKVIAEKVKKLVEKMNQLVLEDIISTMKQFEEQFKKSLEKLDEKQRDYESVRSAMREREELMQTVAELITKPELREAVIKALQKEKEASNDSESSFTFMEMMIESFEGHVKDHNKAGISGQENHEACKLEELLNKLSEIAQQVQESKKMADKEGEDEGERILKDLLSRVKKVKERLLEDLIADLKEYEELFKKCLQESEDYESEKEELMQGFAEWAKHMTKPDRREVVTLAFQKLKEDSNNSSFTLIEMMIGSFKDYVKNCKNAEISGGENYEECSLDELLNKLSEIAQQVIDLKDP